MTYIIIPYGNYSAQTLRLKQSVRHKGGTTKNPESFELREEHPPSEKKQNNLN